MKIYIIFGDIPRSDGENIEGIYLSKENAETMKSLLEKGLGNYIDYHIECFEVED